MKRAENQAKYDARHWGAYTQESDERLERNLTTNNKQRVNKLLYDAGGAWYNNGKTLEDGLNNPESVKVFANNLVQFNSLSNIEMTDDCLHSFEEGFKFAKLYSEGYNIGVVGKIIVDLSNIDHRVKKGYQDGMIEYGRKMYDVTPDLEQFPIEYRNNSSFRNGFLEKLGYDYAINGVSIIELQTKLKKVYRDNSHFNIGYKQGLKEYQDLQELNNGRSSR